MREHLRAIGTAPHGVSGLRLLRAFVSLESTSSGLSYLPLASDECYATGRRELVPQGHVR